MLKNVHAVTMALPWTFKPPPAPDVTLPLATVRFCRLKVTPELTFSTRTALLPLIVTRCPAPSIVRFLEIVSVLESVMV